MLWFGGSCSRQFLCPEPALVLLDVRYGFDRRLQGWALDNLALPILWKDAEKVRHLQELAHAPAIFPEQIVPFIELIDEVLVTGDRREVDEPVPSFHERQCVAASEMFPEPLPQSESVPFFVG